MSLKIQLKQLKEDLAIEKQQTEKYQQQCIEQKELIDQLQRSQIKSAVASPENRVQRSPQMYVLEDSKVISQKQTASIDVETLAKVEHGENRNNGCDNEPQTQPHIPTDPLTIDISTIDAPDSQIRLMQNPFAKNSLLKTDQNQTNSPQSQYNLDEYMFVSDEENEAQNNQDADVQINQDDYKL